MTATQTEILVIGGGATGAGIVCDLALRGFRCILVEKGDLATGTTGRYHGLLHSGGRYVVKDPQAAKECIEENRILRRIMPHCIEDTGGFFVVTPSDDPAYVPKFIHGCKQAGIPVEEVPAPIMLREEPLLDPRITHCLRVPDGSADSFLAADSAALCARQHGAQILNYHKVTGLLLQGQRVVGARCHDLARDEQIEIHADMVVNASGAWAGQIAAFAGLKVHVIPGKGVMLAMNRRLVHTVINRCKMPADGDILVPAHTVSIIGTTDSKVSDPDNFAIEPWEVHLMLEEGEKLIPGFSRMRVLRSWAGVRPLYQETAVADTRDVTRAFVLLDHEERDGLTGLITITSGKWTTYRLMAEKTVDLVCARLNASRPCTTRSTVLPDPQRESHGSHHHYLGQRLAAIEKEHAYGRLVCECELATIEDVTHAIVEGQAKTIDDVRRDARLGMGPCQGGFCTYRVAGLLHRLRQTPVEQTNASLRDFLQERWKGLLPILWGQQLRQERLDELIYLNLLNADHLPGPQSTRLAPELYAQTPSPEAKTTPEPNNYPPTTSPHPAAATIRPPELDLLVIGAGLAGLVSAWNAARQGKRVHLVSKGWGSHYWHTGCIDLLGYYPSIHDRPVEMPVQAIESLISDNPAHPYARLGLIAIRHALSEFQGLCAAAGYPMHGTPERNWLLPSALGAIRPTCLVPETMLAGDLTRPDPILLVNFNGFPDFYPELAAANLAIQGVPSHGIQIDLPTLSKQRFITGHVIADLLDAPLTRQALVAEFQAALHTALRTIAFKPARVGLPAVLGLLHTGEIHHQLQEALKLPVFEIPTLPPSIPGIRLSRLLVNAIEAAGGRVFGGMQVLNAETALSSPAEAPRISTVWSEAAARRKAHRAANYLLATGGILGGGLFAHYDGFVQETVYGLPVQSPPSRDSWLDRRFLSSKPHPIYTTGLAVDDNYHPLDPSGQPAYANLYAAGAILSSGDYLVECSLDTVAIATALAASENLQATI